MVSGSDNAFSRLERGELTLSQFVPVFEREVCGVARSKGVELKSGFSALELFRKINNNYQPCVEMLEAATRVKQRGLKTCIVTNNWIDDIFSVSLAFPSEMFDCILESSKLGMRKPDPDIYRLACVRLGVSPHEVVFLDDLGVNLKSARKLGISTIKVSDPSTAVKELETVLGLKLTRSSKL
ncbi:bifunctional epoxide hydrolase 2-like isoform X2 [Halichondria panicea]